MPPRAVSSICSECGAGVSFELGTPQVTCSHCEAGLGVEQGLHLVRLGCPRCGGNFYYVDGSMCGRCPYCDAALLALTQGGVLRLVVQPAAGRPAGAEAQARLMLLPFWHLGGLLYGWDVGSRVEVIQDSRPTGSEAQGSEEALGQTIRRDSGPRRVWNGRVLDTIAPDPSSLALGVTSLRQRAAVFPLEPFAREHESLGQVVPPGLDHRAAREHLLGRAVRLGASGEGLSRVDCRRLDLVADRLSLYYYPFWVAERDDGSVAVWDGVTGEREPTGAPSARTVAPGGSIFDELRVIELSCSACGGSLAQGNHAAVLPCRGCGRFFQVTPAGLVPFEAQFARPRALGPDPVWLPFWQVGAQVRYAGRVASRVRDIVETLGVLRAPGDTPRSAPDAPLGYFTPAFGALKAPRVDHAARDLTRYQPLLEPTEPPDGELYTCFFSEEDARRLAYVTWIQVIPGTVPHRIRSLRVTTGAAQLWYVPFAQSGRELVNLLTGVRYDRAAFRGVRH